MRIVLSGDRLSLEEVGAVARGGARVEIAAAARERVRAARALVERIAEGDVPTYGINTGFGTLAEVSIPRGDLRKLQRNLVLSHAAGTGAPLPPPEVRALMLLRANVLAGGYSRIRGHEGQARVAADLRALLARSEINAAHQDEHCDKVQDPYSLRCVPQVHGAARDALAFVHRTLAIEANAATDNPLVFAQGLED